ncbi:MAG: RNA polymerase sigma-70 factor [Ferruginibacter sp.]|nr:RNA polymerase sigma-70 factor [Ferruginibacter sp.]
MVFYNEHFIELFLKRDEKAFEKVFKDYFKKLHSYAITIVNDENVAEEIVQNIFFKIWERTGKINLQSSLTAYLYRSVYNESCNYLKHQKVKKDFLNYSKNSIKIISTENASIKIAVSELEKQIKLALNNLPEQCRTVFQLSRFEELKYQEIAEKLGISIKTVEAHMGKALRIMRIKLIDYLPLVFLFLNFVK